MYKYVVTKIWYDEEEIIESEKSLAYHDIRSKLDERRIYCDEVNIEEIKEEDENE